LRSIGVEPEEIDTVIMTHLHTDHAGGIRYFPGSRFLVSPDELGRAGGFLGKLRGYLPDHWPEWFRPDDPAEGVVRKIGPFYPCHSVTTDGAIAILPTEGHTPHHISVLVSTPEMRYLLAGDASYSQVALLNQRPDGVSPAPFAAKRTLRQILALASSKPMVYLPSHDPEAVERLENREPIPGAQAAGALLTGHAGGQRELATVIRGS
jgi:glyoxylase-like metal-dependent hydrolase (beta-lactamase superfamily II)